MTKPVRAIRPNSRSTTGYFPPFGEYESTLERDFMEILRFDRKVESYLPQPVTIEFLDTAGRRRQYTPDGLIRFLPEENLLPVLVEIKHRADFRKDWRSLLPKFRAAKAYCLRQAWEFEVLSENEIRTPYLENIRFLWPYRSRQIEPGLKQRILEVLWDLDECDPELLTCALCKTSSNRAAMIAPIWHLVSEGTIGCDLNKPISMKTPIWPIGDIQ
ncbi:TnsA endonuclease N-terminal domain-containing protein [Marinobacter sp. R17]|uniref:TnsA endonuclease N-terminal domain-containing protein n=1 Tax=Marinobacter sp. R17 TaxID=2484250 RepID=UPI001680B80B|nr:TnsA endonuclease N-terminal domain-containing protein [Marinobacter sp. R17]